AYGDRKSTRLNSSHLGISYAVFCLKKKNVCLGQGPFYGLACETALKLTEMSVSYAQSFHTLEFRHGPKSIVSPKTLLFLLLSDQGYDSECDVLQEMKGLGATILTIDNHADNCARESM